MADQVAHALPLAPQFVGRDQELAELRAMWAAGSRDVIALVGLGGAGKTALAARFLEELARSENALPPDRLFVWSFYQETDADRFLTEAYRHFAKIGDAPAPAKGTGLLHLLREALSTGAINLLVLDGLERVQRESTDHPTAFGQVEDPLLRGLLIRIAEGAGRTVALVTSRFPLTDLQSFQNRGYRHLGIEGLSEPAALALLRRHGVEGDDKALRELVEAYGAHALTLDHLGSLIGQFLGGDPRRAPEAPKFTSPQQDRQALRLARLLRAYETHLPPSELALLCRLCLLERTVRVEQIRELFLCAPLVDVRTVRELERSLKRLASPPNLPAQLPQELAWAIGETILEILRQNPIAGPEESFRQNVVQVVVDLLDRYEQTIEEDVEELIRLYGTGGVEVPTSRRPLPAKDQQDLPRWIARYNELRHHELLPYREEPPTVLEAAFLKGGWVKSSKYAGEPLTPADVASSFQSVKRAIQPLALKHRALLNVRRQCRLFQEKWQASGSLATLDSTALSQVLASLVARHLVLREADGALSVHPAVRDYFGQLANASERGLWHQLIGEQLIRLVQRPGLGLPVDPPALDLAEEAIAHACAAGQPDQAWNLYVKTLGGHRHLAWKLGEMARGLRIVRLFNPCPDRSSLGWYLRALGDLDEACRQNPLPYFRADLRLLQGRLGDVEKEGDPARSAIALFLMGRTTKLPPEPLGCVIPRAQILLYLGRTTDAWLASNPARVYAMIGWEDGRTRCQLFQAEVASRMGDTTGAAEAIDEASRWVLRSGSVEHLCLYHLVRSRILMNDGKVDEAQRAVDEGLLLASMSGLRLYQTDLLCLRAGLMLRVERLAEAEHSARAAVKLASSTDCPFPWGAAKAGHLLGRSLIGQSRKNEARPILENVRSLRLSIGDPRIKQTETLLLELQS
jgi:hypothetical protein